jgi:hypothetical protein
MGTRSSIAIKTEDGIKAIYCHWDGYVDHNGRLLKEFYNTTDKVNELIALGDLSTLGSMIGQKHDFDSKYGPEPELGLTDNWCLAYGRDRGETGTEAQTFDNISSWVEAEAERWCEYFYLFDGQDWIVSNGKKDESGCFEFDFLEVAILKEIVDN